MPKAAPSRRALSCDGVVDRNHSTGRGGYVPSLGEIRNCHINVGTGKELTIRELSELVVKAVGFEGSEVARRFEEYTRNRVENEGLAFNDEIKISATAVKKKTTTSLTMVKLDDNFDIRIHGGEQLIEQGYDEERGMQYYKLYYRVEK